MTDPLNGFVMSGPPCCVEGLLVAFGLRREAREASLGVSEATPRGIARGMSVSSQGDL